MTRSRALSIAIKSMQAEITRLAIEANLHDRLQADYPAARTASKRRQALREAIEVLENVR